MIIASETRNQFITINGTDHWPFDSAYIQCPLGHYTHRFLACDMRSSCWYKDRSSFCDSSEMSRVPSFACTNGIERVAYSLVCDHRDDCVDGSDENFCVVSPCQAGQFTCNNKQCIVRTKVCDGWGDCHGNEEEDKCSLVIPREVNQLPPAIVTLSKYGQLILRPMQTSNSKQNEGFCPRSHFKCLDKEYCLPVFIRCNGIYDCPNREDETVCDQCPGFYRCRASLICLDYSDLCDGHAHCPQHDDEMMCESICPPSCVCLGIAFFCRHTFTASTYTNLRYLDASGSGMTPAHLTENHLLIHITLAYCGLDHINGLVLPNLLSLDIHDNHLSFVSHEQLVGVPLLRELSVAGNPLMSLFEDSEGLRSSDHVLKLDFSRVLMQELKVSMLYTFPNLQVLNLSHSGVQLVRGEGLRIAQHLQVVDLCGCPMTQFPRRMFQGLNDLQAVYADNFKLCCPAVLPTEFNLRNCFAPSDVISSCDDLLRGNIYKMCVLFLCLFAILGNAVSFVFRTYISKRENKLGYGTFVTHLSVSDFLMGVYLAIIGVADLVYHGTYLWNDETWKRSITCKLAGLLSLLSSEVSALTMCLITFDRFLVLRFPFSRLHFSSTSAHAVCVAVWIGCMILVSVPLLPVTSHWKFYSQTGICIPLPITKAEFAGYNYSFSILIVFNFSLFVFICIGQLSIYCSVRANAMSVSNTTKKTKDLTIASRLITVALTDFLCWFPIGVLGVLASSDVAIPGEVNVVVAICVLPLNSAVNPCLYTFNVIMERQNRARGEKLRALLLTQVKAGN